MNLFKICSWPTLESQLFSPCLRGLVSWDVSSHLGSWPNLESKPSQVPQSASNWRKSQIRKVPAYKTCIRHQEDLLCLRESPRELLSAMSVPWAFKFWFFPHLKLSSYETGRDLLHRRRWTCGTFVLTVWDSPMRMSVGDRSPILDQAPQAILIEQLLAG